MCDPARLNSLWLSERSSVHRRLKAALKDVGMQSAMWRWLPIWQMVYCLLCFVSLLMMKITSGWQYSIYVKVIACLRRWTLVIKEYINSHLWHQLLWTLFVYSTIRLDIVCMSLPILYNAEENRCCCLWDWLLRNCGWSLKKLVRDFFLIKASSFLVFIHLAVNLIEVNILL